MERGWRNRPGRETLTLILAATLLLSGGAQPPKAWASGFAPVMKLILFGDRSITLEFSQPLDETSIPDPSDFTLTTDALTYPPPIQVEVVGTKVTLTYSQSVPSLPPFTLTYKPGTRPIRGLPPESYSVAPFNSVISSSPSTEDQYTFHATGPTSGNMIFWPSRTDLSYTAYRLYLDSQLVETSATRNFTLHNLRPFFDHALRLDAQESDGEWRTLLDQAFRPTLHPDYVKSGHLEGPLEPVAGSSVPYKLVLIDTEGATHVHDFLWRAPTEPGERYVYPPLYPNKVKPLRVLVVAGGPVRLHISPSGPLVLAAGETVQFTAEMTDAQGNQPVGEWEVSWRATGVGSMDGTRFSSLAPGRAFVYASSGKLEIRVDITVVPAPAHVAVITPTHPELSPGQSQQFHATVLDPYGNRAEYSSITWKATGGSVTAAGRFKPDPFLTEGSVTVIVTTRSGTISSKLALGWGQPEPALPDTAVPHSALVQVRQNWWAATQIPLQDSEPEGRPLIHYFHPSWQQWVAVPTTISQGSARGHVPAGAFAMVMERPGVWQPEDTASHWANAEILKLQSLGILSGFPDGTFQPEGALTRYQVAKVVALAARLGSPAGSWSVPERVLDRALIPQWAAPFVAQAVIMDWMPLEDGLFHGDRVVTRQELATIVGRLLPIPETPPPLFTDAQMIDPAAREWVERAVAAGLFSGFPNGTFRPHDALTRAQMAKVISLLIDRLH